jgi:hypothetical protein
LPTILERLNLFYREIHNKRAPGSSPAVAVDAADELLTITVDLDQRLLAALAFHIIDSSESLSSFGEA